jgi:hypothetical protein
MTEAASQQNSIAASQTNGPADLTEVSQLQSLFSQDDGQTRLLLLLSPT